jgi:hypothetical protein
MRKQRLNCTEKELGVLFLVFGLAILHGSLFPGKSRIPWALNLPYKTYVWKGGVYPKYNKDHSINPDAGKEYCFAYGEKDWLSGSFEDTQKRALKNAYNHKSSILVSPLVNCP